MRDEKMKNYQVMLIDGTCGQIEVNLELSEGDYYWIDLHDENGMPVSAFGEIREIFDVTELC